MSLNLNHTTSIHSRLYESEQDLQQMQKLLMEARAYTNDWRYPHVGDLLWWFFMVDRLEVSMIKVCIQVEAGSRDKNLYNEKTLEYQGMSRVSRPYPYPYGFIIGTSAADGDSVDCYLITKDKVKRGTLVECEPVGLLEQDEDGEIDHKVLAAIPGQDVELGQGLLEELRDFIYSVFTRFPEIHIRIGRLLPREAALHHIQEFRVRENGVRD